MAILVDDNIRNALDMLDEQPAAVIEAILARAMQRHQSGDVLKHRNKMQVAFIEYFEERLHEAQAGEGRLVQALTGAEGLPDDSA